MLFAIISISVSSCVVSASSFIISGLLAITLKGEDELISVKLTDGQDNVVLVTRKGICITFSEKDVRPIGRTAQGVIGMRIGKDDYVIGMEPII